MSRTRPTVRRSLAALGAAALVAPLLPAVLATPAAAAPVVVLRDVREFACPPGQVRPPGAGARFDDTAGTTFELEIDCLAGYEITLGVGDGRTYAPAGTVTRAQMAQFLARVAARAGFVLDTRDAGFTDLGGVSAGARDAINGLANADVAQGRTATVYDPQGPVRRDQMASFLARLQQRVEPPFRAGEDYFTDDDGSTHEANVNRIAAAGIAQGVGGGAYGPERSITRQQMAGFLTRYLDILVAAQEIAGRYERNNGVLPVSPAESAALDVGQERTFTATSLQPGVEYRVTLVETRTVRTASDDTLRFTDTDGDRLAEVGEYTARITTVNGRAVADGMPSTATSVPDSGGQLTVQVRGNRDTDDVLPVLYPNTGRSPRLELAADLRPVEVFGVGGRTTFSPPEAAAGEVGEGDVIAHDRSRSRVTLDLDGNGTGDRVYDYSTGNTYAIGGTAHPRETFVARLTRGDRLNVERYSTSPGGSSFDITDDTPAAPEVSAVRGGTTATAGRITVTVTPSRPAALATYDRFVLERAQLSGHVATGDSCVGGVVGSYQQIAEEPPSADADAQTAGFQYVDQPGAGCFRYRAWGVVDGQASPTGQSNNVSSAPPSSSQADTTRPVSDSASVSRDVGASGTADAGDQLTIVFSEAMAAPAADAFLQVRTAAGDVVTIRNASNGVPQFRMSGSTLTIELAVGSNVGPYPLEVLEAGRITDTAGNPWWVETSPDRVIEN